MSEPSHEFWPTLCQVSSVTEAGQFLIPLTQTSAAPGHSSRKQSWTFVHWISLQSSQLMPINIQVKPCPSSEAGGGETKRDSRDFTNRSQWTMVTSFPLRREEERGAQLPLRFFLTVTPLGELSRTFSHFIVKSLSFATFKCRDQSFKLKSLHPDKSCQLLGSYRTM